MKVCLGVLAGEALFVERADDDMERGLDERPSFSVIRVDSRRDEWRSRKVHG